MKPAQDLADWTGATVPDGRILTGQFGHLALLDAQAHSAHLYAEFAGHEGVWTYLPWTMPTSEAAMFQLLTELVADPATAYYAVIDLGGRPLGIASYLNIVADQGRIEVGGIAFSPVLQRTRLASEAMMLMMAHAFVDLGYRRYEWKCNALNAPSRRAAARLGFSYEGVFRNHMVVKGGNRDTAWFAITDSDWTAIAPAHRQWLHSQNFEHNGQQKQRLSDLIKAKIDIAPDPMGAEI